MSNADETAAERPQARLGGAPGRAEPTAATDEPAAASDPSRIGYIGKRLGRFLISAELGRGGMATVYRARDPQVGRDVAVKVMHGFFAGRPEIEARFRREATAVAAIRHPSILSLFDFVPPVGEDPGYIVSELIEGPGLRQLVENRGGRLSPEGAALVTLRVAEALGAAHDAGIVHRDVKPDNVLIDRATDGARIVLTDFGVAHVSGLDTMTATGAVLGSPAYMSPEQARGDDVGPPSDVFALGVLTYQLCTGHLPFPGKDPLTVITGILRGEYARPGKWEARVGVDLDQVITRCLAREPAARYANGMAVASALRDVLLASGINDEQAALRRFLADPEAFDRGLAQAIAARAMAAAEQARRRRQIPRALAEVGRALAYAPDDVAARGLLSRLGSRQKSLWVRGVLAGVTAAAAAMLVMTLVHRAAKTGDAEASRAPPPATVIQEPAARAPSPSPASASSVFSGATSGATPIDNATPSVRPGGTTSASGIAEVNPRSRGDSRSPARARPTATRASVRRINEQTHAERPSVVLPTGVATGASNHAGPETEAIAVDRIDTLAAVRSSGSSAPEAAPPVEAGASGSVILRASHGFCEPSLDDHPPSLRASYNNLAPGPHEIYCTLPQGGGKIHVATYDLRPGKRPSLIVVPGPNGRPTLNRPQ